MPEEERLERRRLEEGVRVRVSFRRWWSPLFYFFYVFIYVFIYLIFI